MMETIIITEYCCLGNPTHLIKVDLNLQNTHMCRDLLDIISHVKSNISSKIILSLFFLIPDNGVIL